MRKLLVVATVIITGTGGVRVAAQPAPIDFSQFHTPAQVDGIMIALQSAYPGLCKIIPMTPTTHEGRAIKAIKISDNVTVDESDEGDVVFFALHHAREWLSVEMALYLTEHILANYSTNAQLQADVNNLEIWIVPVVNPDGFAYTQLPPASPTDPLETWPRYWRKNRRDNLDGSYGVDLNRNWGFQWGLSSGSSPWTWHETYRGPSAFSEPETIALRNFVKGLHNLKTLVTYHTFSQLFLRPWSYTTADAPGEETLKQLVLRSIAAIQAVHGVTYSETISYTSSGETTDYLWGEMRVSAFTPEMRPPPPLVITGFSPPASQIIPNNQENLPAAVALIHDAGSREVWIRDYSGDTGYEPSAVWTGSGWSHAFWESPDIWTVPEKLDQGTTVQMNVRINNNTGATKINVRVDVYWTDPRISLEFPNPDATLIGTQTVSVPPAGATITMPWVVPTGTNSWGERHWCVGAVIYNYTDMPLTTEAQRTSNVGIRNMVTAPLIVAGNLIVAATNHLAVDAELQVYVDRRKLPDGWRVTLPEPPAQKQQPVPSTCLRRKGVLLGAKGRLLGPGETVYVPVHVAAGPNAKSGDIADLAVHAALLPLVAGKREPVGNGFSYRVVVDPEGVCKR